MAILIYSFWFLLFTFFTYMFLKKQKNPKSNLRFPPGPSGFPIIGNLHLIKDLPHRFFHTLSIKYGPMLFLKLGSNPVVVISSSEAAEELLKIQDLETCSRPKLTGTGKLSYNFKGIIFAQYTDSWKQNRKVTVLELLNLKKIQSFKAIREEEMEFMVKKLSKSASEQNSIVDLSKITFFLAANILCRSALGQNLRENKFFNEERIEELVNMTSITLRHFRFNDFFPGRLGKFVDWLFRRNKELEKVCKELDEFYQHVIDDHLESKGRKSTDPSADIVAGLLDMVDKHDDHKRDLDRVKATIMDLFLGGTDTSSITLAWAMTELARNPRVMNKVQDEIRTVLGNTKKKITEEDIEKVEYLKLVIKETLRLHPAIPTLRRQSMSHIKIQGYDIPPNTRIYVNVWGLGQDPKLWENPGEFIPERFIDSSIHYKGQNYELLPFGSGRRICPGMVMAIPTLELGLLNLLYFFDWKLPNEISDIDMQEDGSITIFKKLPLLLVPIRRH